MVRGGRRHGEQRRPPPHRYRPYGLGPRLPLPRRWRCPASSLHRRPGGRRQNQEALSRYDAGTRTATTCGECTAHDRAPLLAHVAVAQARRNRSPVQEGTDAAAWHAPLRAAWAGLRLSWVHGACPDVEAALAAFSESAPAGYPKDLHDLEQPNKKSKLQQRQRDLTTEGIQLRTRPCIVSMTVSNKMLYIASAPDNEDITAHGRH